MTMLINSPGGSVSDGLQIYDMMQFMKSEGVIIETQAKGIAMSMGSLLLVGGSKGHRYAWPSSQIMLHQVSAGAMGTNENIQTRAQQIDLTNDRLKALYKVHTNMTKSEINKVFTNQDYFMMGEEAANLGIVDHVKYPKNLPDVAKFMKKSNTDHWKISDGRLRQYPGKKLSNDNNKPASSAPKNRKSQGNNGPS